ncbi:Asparaginyl-tRNA synthetase, cytoplasmic (Asparagine--tRNA ligase) (AsnRS) [Balamuthia mandrillaris]
MKKRTVVLMDGNPGHEWGKIFADSTLADGTPVRLIQAAWNKVTVTVYDGKALMGIAPIYDSDNVDAPNEVNVTPDFFVMRNQVRGPKPGGDFRHVLFGLMAGHVPAINSLESEYMNLERPIMFAALKGIEQRLGHDKFPLIPQNYYGTPDQMVISPDLPCIVKVSHAHAGMGKAIINDQGAWRDLATVLALHGDYCTAEPYIDAEYGIRVQKIGPSVRVMKKNYTGSTWKSQFGGSSLEEIEPTEQHKLWAEECSKLFGGMDILAVDALHGKDGKDYIIELNATAIGVLASMWEEESIVLRDLVLQRMNQLYCGEEGGTKTEKKGEKKEEEEEKNKKEGKTTKNDKGKGKGKEKEKDKKKNKKAKSNDKKKGK